MTRAMILAAAVAGSVASLALAATQQPGGLSQAMGGLWEVSGVPGAKAPVRQCFGSVGLLAQFEHRTKSCTRKVTSENAASTVIDYSCGGAGFGRTKVDVLTPRSLRLETQGISDNLPFNYVLQARRVGDCATSQSASRH
jgi:hypothetical protein